MPKLLLEVFFFDCLLFKLKIDQNILSGVKLDSKALINQQNPPLDQSKPPAQKNQFFDLEIGKSVKKILKRIIKFYLIEK